MLYKKQNINFVYVSIPATLKTEEHCINNGKLE